MKESKNISQEADHSPQSDVLILPSEYFFTERVNVPKDVSSSELPDFAELSIEGIAPFPLDQLRWGFVPSVDGKSALIYAAHNERLKRAGFTDLESYKWVLPDLKAFDDTETLDIKEITQKEETKLWEADIRPKSYKIVERKSRNLTTWITRILYYAALFTLFLITIEGLLLVSKTWLGTRQAKIDSQRAEVLRIEDKHSLMNKLEQVAQNELRPITILEVANQIRIDLKNSGIEYDEVVIEGLNRLTIEGKASTINELNEYTKALRASGNFQLAEDPKSITRSGKTTFTATLDYLHTTPSKSIGGVSQ